MGGKTAKFTNASKSIERITFEYSHALRVLAEDKTGMDFRTIIQKSVPKHMRQDVKTLVEESRKPRDAQTCIVGFQMLQDVAVANQVGGRYNGRYTDHYTDRYVANQAGARYTDRHTDRHTDRCTDRYVANTRWAAGANSARGTWWCRWRSTRTSSSSGYPRRATRSAAS